ncbi:hypothetical protein HQ637_04910 [Enterococcus faecium]|nr:hypothetical protein [Enterococcus faecium]NTK14488.1 hypothetical protein [Enterococcus faecium]
MRMSDTLFIGFILVLLVLVAHYNVVAGLAFATMMFLINLLDIKRPTRDGRR